MRLWDKGGAVDEAMLRFTARDDWQLDNQLLPFDLRATRAHVIGLGAAKVLTSDEVDSLVAAVDKLSTETEAGTFRVTEEFEDGHSAIETTLIERLGDLGKKVHTGRSRNDQVLVAMRLLERDRLDAIIDGVQTAGAAFLEMAEQRPTLPMPGYTHLQRAVPSSVGFWAASFADQLADTLPVLAAARAQVDRSPLGGAAGYGVNLPLEREIVAQELGFSAVALNPMASQASRGVVEVGLLAALWQVSATIRRFAWDLSLFCTSEFGFVKLPMELTTGSSIMPQKRNPDVAELLRGSTAIIQGAMNELMTLSAMPSGYQRDFQLTKAPVLRALDETQMAVTLVPVVVRGMAWQADRMAAAITPECYATDRAVELANEGVPFREAYRRIAEELGIGTDPKKSESQGVPLEQRTPEDSLMARTALGCPGNLALEQIRGRFGQ